MAISLLICSPGRCWWACTDVLWPVGLGPSDTIHIRNGTALRDGGHGVSKRYGVYDNIPCVRAFRSRRRTVAAAPVAITHAEGRPKDDRTRSVSVRDVSSVRQAV
uniref:Secreted protein n=1 Tax=Anopheles culicifacies TaxID=139723 RepID=A0A182MG75_9DIPT